MKLWKTDVSALRSRIELLEGSLGNLLESTEALDRRVADVSVTVANIAAQVKLEALSGAELYDKTYHLLKRHEARDRAKSKVDNDLEGLELVADDPPEQAVVGDPVTDRVLQRRRKSRGVSPVIPR